LLDILSDETGVSLHRLQCLIFNLVIGGWMVYKIFLNMALLAVNSKFGIDNIIPDVMPNNLVLLGISAGTYIALKSNENKPASVTNTVGTTSITTTTVSPASAAAALANQLAPSIAPLISTVLNSGAVPEFIKDEALFKNNPAAG